MAAILAVILVLAASFSLVAVDNIGKHTKKVEEYLFSGNRPVLAVSSGIGSIFSLSISCTAFLSGGFVYGWQIIAPFLLGLLAAYLALASFAKSQSGLDFCGRIELAGRQSGTSQFLLLSQRGMRKSYFLASTIAVLFYLSMLATEIAVGRVFLKSLLPVNATEVSMLLFAFLATSYAYVFMGGFRGVLLTDHLQIVVVLSLLGVLVGSADIARVASAVPSPLMGEIEWSEPSQLLILHGLLFAGTFMLITGSVDQWIRTFGTLRANSVTPTLRWSIACLGIGGSIPILLGATARNLIPIPQGATNTSALWMLKHLVSGPGSLGIFLFSGTLACIAMTTIDTYIVTIQQLYYEISIRIRAKTSTGYFFEYVLKWRQIRLVSAVAISIAVAASFLISDEQIYFFGVLALSGPIFLAPVLILELVEIHARSAWVKFSDQFFSLSLALSLVGFWPLLRYFEANIGDASLHLYLIIGSAAISSLASFSLLGLGEIVKARWFGAQEN